MSSWECPNPLQETPFILGHLLMMVKIRLSTGNYLPWNGWKRPSGNRDLENKTCFDMLASDHPEFFFAGFSHVPSGKLT